MNKFHGSVSELKAAVAACNLNGECNEAAQNGLKTFRAKTGEILNRWPSNGTLQFQGKNQESFRALLAGTLGSPTL